MWDIQTHGATTRTGIQNVSDQKGHHKEECIVPLKKIKNHTTKWKYIYFWGGVPNYYP